MTARPLTRAEITLLEIEWEARELVAFAIATSITCGPTRPACKRLIRTAIHELLKLSDGAYYAAEQRVARRIG